MLLITAATEKEIKPLEQFIAATAPVDFLITGMGPVITASSLSHYLTLHGSGVHAVLNIGVAGAYMDAGIAMLDICLAQQEFLGDFGICMHDGIQDFDPGLLERNTFFIFNNDLMLHLKKILHGHDIAFKVANFVTVNCCTGTEERGRFLQRKFSAGCENMEGAAVVMVCNNFDIPCIELRCVSNMVEDRDIKNWQLGEAIKKICHVTETVLFDLIQEISSHN